MWTPNEDAERLQRGGRGAYRSKEFELAMKLFSQALEVPGISASLQLHVLDNRAATQEKLGGADALRAALADAKKMIQLQKTGVNGYLRAGKILQLQGNDKLALDLYKYGLKRIAPNDDDGRELLQGMYQKVLSRAEESKAIKCMDMMFILPLELVEMVLQKLPFHTLMLAQGVSKTWRQFLITSHQTYKNVDFTGAKRSVSKYAFKTCVSRSRGGITKLTVRRLNFAEGEPLVYLATRCKDLSYVRIIGCDFGSWSIVEMAKVAGNLKTLALGCRTSMSAIAEVISQCDNLESFECLAVTANVPALWNESKPMRLRRLVLAATEYSSFQSVRLQGLLEQLPKLRELELMDWLGSDTQLDFSALEDFRVFTVLRSAFLVLFPLLPPTVQRLNLSENPNLVCTLEDIAASPLPNIEFLSFRSNPKLTNEMVLALLEPSLGHCRLRVLKMGMCPRLDFDSLDWLLGPGYGEMLEELEVAGNSTFGDQVSKELGGVKLLKKLDASSTRISGIGVLNLLNRSENAIEWVCLDGCDSVGYDAVEKFRGMGISVSYKISDMRGGKRVRYRD